MLEKVRLIDVNPIKLSPTWRNKKRVGSEQVAKKLDRIFIFEELMESGKEVNLRKLRHS